MKKIFFLPFRLWGLDEELSRSRSKSGSGCSGQDDSRANNFYKLYAHMPAAKGKTNRNRGGKKLYKRSERQQSGDILGEKAITSRFDDWVRCRTPTRLTAPMITSNNGRPSSFLLSELILFAGSAVGHVCLIFATTVSWFDFLYATLEGRLLLGTSIAA